MYENPPRGDFRFLLKTLARAPSAGGEARKRALLRPDPCAETRTEPPFAAMIPARVCSLIVVVALLALASVDGAKPKRKTVRRAFGCVGSDRR